MSVLVEDATESVTSADVEVVKSVRFGDRLGERAQVPRRGARGRSGAGC
jgi:hypothetical protein